MIDELKMLKHVEFPSANVGIPMWYWEPVVTSAALRSTVHSGSQWSKQAQ